MSTISIFSPNQTFLNGSGEDKPKPKDLIAALVMMRFEQAHSYKTTHTHYQSKTPHELLVEARNQFNKVYDDKMKQALKSINPSEPHRYFGLTQIKVNAMRAWKRDLVFSNMDAIFSVAPSPVPTLDDYTTNNIKNSVKQAFADRLVTSGVLDSSLLLSPDGTLPPQVTDIIDQQLKYFRGIEEARLVSKASQSAKRIETQLQDILVESNFRQQYADFTQNQALYGIACMKFPAYTPTATLQHSSNQNVRAQYKSIPNFRSINPFHLFPTSDGATLQDCAGVTEVVWMSKYELLRLLKVKARKDEAIDYQAIKDILQEYQNTNRNWIHLPYTIQDMKTHSFWDMDATIPALVHEGFVSGRELRDMGFSGYDDYDYANVEAIVVAHRTISMRIIKSPKGEERSYFSVPFIRTGSDIWDCIGLAAMLKDTEDRVNMTLRLWENNVQWSSIPTYVYNQEAFATKNIEIRPGVALPVNQELFEQVGNRIPDPVRPIQTVSSQYQLLWSAVTQWVRMADEECGIPAFAYGAANFGKASLGEYAQRMSNALRTVKEAAAEEDAHFIEPAFEMMYRRLLQENKELIEGQDIDLQVRGITGLLSKDLQGSSSREQMATVLNLSQTRPDIVDNALVEYSIYNYLRNEGFPVDALGLSNPLVDNALDMAAARAANGSIEQPQMDAFETQQVPQLDGRSGGINPQTVANTDGRFNYGLGTNQYNTPQGE